MYSINEVEDQRIYCIMQGNRNFLFRLRRPLKALSSQERIELGSAFIKKMAEEGALTGILKNREVREAFDKGKLPDRYNIHHYFPLSMGGGHQEANLCIIDKRLHKWIHAYLLDPIFRDAKFDFWENKKVYLMLPQKKRVFTMKDASLFFTVEEIERIQEDERNGLVPEYVAPKVNDRDTVSMLRFAEQLKRDMDLFDQETKEKNEMLVETIMRQIKGENAVYRRKGKQISKYWNERREGKTKMPLTRREKALKSAKKAKKSAARRFYPHLAVIWNQKERS
ncbi:MAG: hypothetical protein J6V53_00075 [Alphaproteobacteria bacterium]|nr:hypothetical protein [Alphaproteobacteria bacterium]